MRLLPLSGALEHCLRGLSEKTPHVLTTSTGRRVTARYLSVRFKHFARLSGLNEQMTSSGSLSNDVRVYSAPREVGGELSLKWFLL